MIVYTAINCNDSRGLRHLCYLYGEFGNTPTTLLPSTYELCTMLPIDECHLAPNVWTKDERSTQMAGACGRWQDCAHPCIISTRTTFRINRYLPIMTIPVFGDVTMCRWVNGSQRFDGTHAFIFKGQEANRDGGPLDPWRWKYSVPSKRRKPFTTTQRHIP